MFAPLSSSRVGFGWYPKSTSTRVPESASTRVDLHLPEFASASIMRSFGIRPLWEVAESALRRALCRVFWVVRNFLRSVESARYAKFPKLGRSGIVNLRSVMNCQSLSAPKALVKMSAI